MPAGSTSNWLARAWSVTTVTVGLIVVTSLLGLVWPAESWLMFGASPTWAFEYWRPLLFGLTTQGFGQLIAAGLAIGLVMPTMERTIGTRSTAAVFALSGLGAATALALAGPTASMSGALCAVFGLLAAQGVVKQHQHLDYRGEVALLVVMVIYTLAIGAQDWIGAVGGAVAGAVCGAIWAWSPRQRRGGRLVAGFVAVGVIWLGLLTATWIV